MSAIIALLTELIPLIPGLIQAGKATVELWDKVQAVIDENRSPDSAEWDDLEALIAEKKVIVDDTTRDVSQ